MRVVKLIAVFLLFGLVSTAELLKIDDYKLIDSNKTKTSLYSYLQKDKPSIIIFYAEWCPYCKNEMVYLNELIKVNKKISVLAISLDSDPAAIKRLIEKYDITFPIVYASQEMVKDFQVRGIPVTLFVQNNNVVEKMVGFDKDSLEKIVKSMMISK